MHGTVVTCQLTVTVKYSLFILHVYPKETSADIGIKDLMRSLLRRFVMFSILNMHCKIIGVLQL